MHWPPIDYTLCGGKGGGVSFASLWVMQFALEDFRLCGTDGVNENENKKFTLQKQEFSNQTGMRDLIKCAQVLMNTGGMRERCARAILPRPFKLDEHWGNRGMLCLKKSL